MNTNTVIGEIFLKQEGGRRKRVLIEAVANFADHGGYYHHPSNTSTAKPLEITDGFKREFSAMLLRPEHSIALRDTPLLISMALIGEPVFYAEIPIHMEDFLVEIQDLGKAFVISVN